MDHKYISGKNNAFIADIRKLKQKKHRDRTGLFYVEGTKLFKEVLDSDYRKNIKYIIYAETEDNKKAPLIKELSAKLTEGFIAVTPEVYKKITDEEAFEGVMCVIEKPRAEVCLSYEKPVIILSSVRDPGNVGAIIRTAYALCGFEMIISQDCADIYSGKTQRAAMGAAFRQKIKISGNLAEDIANLKKNGYNIFAAHLDKNSRPVNEAGFDAKTAVVFGNEGSGLDGATVSACDGKIIIPINPNSESLNVSVAAGIVLWEMRKKIN